MGRRKGRGASGGLALFLPRPRPRVGHPRGLPAPAPSPALLLAKTHLDTWVPPPPESSVLEARPGEDAKLSMALAGGGFLGDPTPSVLNPPHTQDPAVGGSVLFFFPLSILTMLFFSSSPFPKF